MTAHPNVAAMEADILSFTTALEELESEIVAERAIARAAEAEAREMDEKASQLMEELREARAEIAAVEAERDEFSKEARELEKERDRLLEGEDSRMADAQDALYAFLDENGYGAGNGFVRDRFVQALMDAIL